MATIGKLLVRIGANTKGFRKGLRGARDDTATFSKSVRKLGIGIAAMGAGAAAAAVAGVAALTRASLKSVDAMAKMSDRLGANFEEMQALAFANKLAGNEISVLNMGLQRMTRRVSEAAQGTGEAVNALAELRVDATELVKLSPDEQFRVLADAVNQFGNQADRVRLSMKLFDSEGVALVNTMKGGSEALEENSKNLREMGLLLKRTDASNIEDANNAFSTLGAILDATKDKLAAELAPTITDVTLKLIDMAIASGGADKIVSGFFKNVVKWADAAMVFLRPMLGILNLIRATIGVPIAGIGKIGGGFGAFGDNALNDFGTGAAQTAKAAWGDAMDQLGMSGKPGFSLEKFIDSAKGKAAGADPDGASIETLIGIMEQIRDNTKTANAMGK